MMKAYALHFLIGDEGVVVIPEKRDTGGRPAAI